MNWQVRKIGDLVALQRGHDLTETERKDGTVPVIGSAGQNGWHDVARAPGPGVTIGRSGGSIGKITFVEQDYWPHNTCIYVTDFKGNNPRFVSYLLGTINLASLNSGAAQPSLNRNFIYGVEVRYPAPAEQQSISSILSAYDEAIENNRRRMALLEKAARLLYEEWFVRLRFPGHEHTPVNDGVPQGWERVLLGSKVTLNYGKALKAEHRVEGVFPVYGSSGIVGTHEAALSKGPGIIVGRKGNVGSVFWSSKDFFPIDTVYFISREETSLYLYYALRNMQFLSTDVAVPGLNRDFAHSRPLLWPTKAVLRQFEEAAIPLQQQCDKLDAMNQKLRAARDLLLPRLISGEIEV